MKYYELATDMTLEEVAVVKKRLESGEHPNILKIELAQRVITMYHGKPYDVSDVSAIEEFHIGNSPLIKGAGGILISDLLKELSFCATSWDVRNALTGKSICVDGVVIEDPKHLVTITADGTLVEMGKKKAKRVTL